MNSERKNQLLEKRAQLQLRIRFNEFVTYCITPFLEILEELQNAEIEYRILSLRCIPEEFHELLCDYLKTEALSKYQLAKVMIKSEDSEVATVLEKYPSANPFRYVLDVAVVGYGNQPDEVLQELVETHQITNEKVYVCWLNYAFLIELDLEDLAAKANNELFTPWHHDVLLFPKNYDWLIVYSLEDEWRFKSLKTN